ncbi:polyprenyl diphosphate synthase [Halosegnis marinus]|uniref:Tritrans,polycis-undecaprenyl-diphosphate synthase (geranylgeranyl-diphosphate specific) n=1 Tax=Halosegnis marinus TaxID=3034023 RepID=A0ABD5ZLD0_9EURY|nr:polyprenyl diphosphate synthase [Halosegnis sp. DT85]
MTGWLRRRALSLYERLLERELGGAPSHVAVIQDGNRRYAESRGKEKTEGHRAGAETTEAMLRWCRDLGVEELTLYAFSTENFDRPEDEREALFDLIESKLRGFADRDEVHENGVRIRAIGEVERLPERVRDAVAYADRRTRGYDDLRLNVALAYGGRAELLNAARAAARDVAAGRLSPADIDAAELDRRLASRPTRDVDLIIRTGGDERTSNFLPWHANGNEAAVFFCTPYWPEFRRVDFLRAIRTYEAREESWRRTRARRALALVSSFRGTDLPEARRVLDRLRGSLSEEELAEAGVEGAAD